MNWQFFIGLIIAGGLGHFFAMRRKQPMLKEALETLVRLKEQVEAVTKIVTQAAMLSELQSKGIDVKISPHQMNITVVAHIEALSALLKTLPCSEEMRTKHLDQAIVAGKELAEKTFAEYEQKLAKAQVESEQPSKDAVDAFLKKMDKG